MGFVLPSSARSPPSLGGQACPPSSYFPPPPGVFPSTGPLPSTGIPNMPHVNQLPPGQQHHYNGAPSPAPYQQEGGFQNHQPMGSPSQPQALAPKEESRK